MTGIINEPLNPITYFISCIMLLLTQSANFVSFWFSPCLWIDWMANLKMKQ